MNDMYFSAGENESEIVINLMVQSTEELERRIEELNDIAEKCHRVAFKINVDIGYVQR